MVKFKKYAKKMASKAYGYAKKRYTGANSIRNIVRDVGMLKTLINVEKKRVSADIEGAGNTEINFDHTNLGPLVANFNGPAQSLDANGRTGNSIKLTSVHITGRVRQQTSTTDPQKVLMVLAFRKDGSSAMSAGDMFDTDAQGSYSPMSFTNPDKFSDWLIIAKKTFIVGSRTLTGAQMDYTFQVHKKVKIHQRFNASTGSAIESMRPYLFLLTDSGTTASSDGLKFIGQYRQFYVDN